MKVVILAGGLGTRLSEETQVRPKPMVDIGAKPILWHIMKIYSAHGFNDFIVCLSADMRTSPVADKFFPADGHEISPAVATSSPQN
jgi:NDP-sugar pyrophosphorylase family protein